MYKVSVTVLEKFRRYMSEASSYDTEEALLDCIKGIFQGNDKTKFGGAYHKIIEGDFEILSGVQHIEADGVVFPFEVARPALMYRKAHPQISHEIPVSKIFETHIGPIRVTGRVDATEGLLVRDAKTKFRNIDIEEYIDSCQWKFYLHMLDADEFWYDLFEVKKFQGFVHGNQIEEEVRVIQHESLQCLRYHSMEHEAQTILEDFISYVSSRNLFSYLIEKKRNESILD